MKYLTDEYWESFLKEKKDKDGKIVKVRNGEKFERLVEKLLNLMYDGENIEWEKTHTTHDGNKDFIGKKDDGSAIWAECKNYNEKISVKTIAPTLVMAEIDDIQEILVFSYSEINSSAKKKLIQYANKREKNIYFYDDINLEQILFKHRTKIFKLYFPDFKDNISITEKIEPYIFQCSMPGIYYDKDDIGVNEFSVKLNELFFIGVGIVNNNLDKALKIRLKFHKNNDLKNLEIVDKNIDQSKKFNWESKLVIPPGKAEFIKLYFKVITFQNEIKIPSIQICFEDKSYKDRIISFKKILCKQTFSTPFIGSQYQNNLKNLISNTINKGRLSLGIVYGKSGVGKSRFLNEALSKYLSQHYQILNFTVDSLSKDSMAMLKEFLYYIYNIVPEMTTEFFVENEENIKGIENYIVLQLLKCLHDQNLTEVKNFIDQYKYLVYDKILSQKIVLIIDNLQFAEPFFIDFIYDLCIYGKDRKKNSNFVLLISYNEDYFHSNSLKKLIILAEEMRNSYELNSSVHSIEGFYKNTGEEKEHYQSLGFLKELIHTTYENNIYLSMIVKKANHIPKSIENIVYLLMNKNVLEIENNYSVIKNYEKFYETINNLPDSFEKTFELRLNHFLNYEKLCKNDIMFILGAIHFLGCLSEKEFVDLNLNIETVKKLEKYNFITYDNYGCTKKYNFEHDLYENYFTKHYKLTDVFIGYVLENNNITYKFNDWQKCLFYIYDSNNHFGDIKETLYKIPTFVKKVPFKVKRFFYNKVINYLSESSLSEDNFDDYIYCINAINQDCKNSLGTKFSKEMYEQIYKIISNKSIKDRESSVQYREFINDYCEVLLQTSDKDVIEIYNERIRFFSNDVENNYIILASLYNRVYVFYKLSKKEKTVHQHLENSQELCDKYNLIYQEAENLFDEGNYYLYLPDKKDKIIECWTKGCSIYCDNKEALERLTLNVYKKGIQIKLLQHNYDNAEDLIDKAFDYIETGKYNQQSLFFYCHLYYLKAVYCFLTKKLSIAECNKILDSAARYNNMLNNKKTHNIYFLYAKLYYESGNFPEMFINYGLALQNINRK